VSSFLYIISPVVRIEYKDLSKFFCISSGDILFISATGIIYGSRVTGTNKDNSDFDLFITTYGTHQIIGRIPLDNLLLEYHTIIVDILFFPNVFSITEIILFFN
jgi:hypothetical protein